jgi:hypothetical protein
MVTAFALGAPARPWPIWPPPPIPGCGPSVSGGDALGLLDLWSPGPSACMSLRRRARNGAAPAPDRSPRPARRPRRTDPALLDAIELARVLGRLAPTVWVYAIKGACWDVGRAVSPAVAVAVEQVADELIGLA